MLCCTLAWPTKSASLAAGSLQPALRVSHIRCLVWLLPALPYRYKSYIDTNKNPHVYLDVRIGKACTALALSPSSCLTPHIMFLAFQVMLSLSELSLSCLHLPVPRHVRTLGLCAVASEEVGCTTRAPPSTVSSRVAGSRAEVHIHHHHHYHTVCSHTLGLASL